MKFHIFQGVLLFLQSYIHVCVYIYIYIVLYILYIYIFIKYKAIYSGVYYYSFKAHLNESKMLAFANGVTNTQPSFEKSYMYTCSFIYSIRQDSIYCAVYYYSYSHMHLHMVLYIP